MMSRLKMLFIEIEDEPVEWSKRSQGGENAEDAKKQCTFHKNERRLLTFYLNMYSHLHLFHNPCTVGQPELHRLGQRDLCSGENG